MSGQTRKRLETSLAGGRRHVTKAVPVMLPTDTIAAIATPLGAGGIGVIKISGPAAESALRRLLPTDKSHVVLESHRLYHGFILDSDTGTTVDEVLYTLMRRPRSYTREDVVEIQAHGSRCGLNRILDLLCRQEDVRLAEPGEFTKRAFLNGRIDLTQAEAVAELISAQTPTGHQLAARQLAGDLRRQVESMHRHGEQLLVEVEAAVDFPEDMEDILQSDVLSERLATRIIGPLEHLVAAYDEGHVYREGVCVILIGKPNVGKSSLMNCLVQKERAIVTTYPGTTRDFIEETVNVGGIPLRLIDTAGLRHTDDDLEAVGIRLTREQLDGADIILFVIDGSAPVSHEDDEIFGDLSGRDVVLIANKSDLPVHTSLQELKTRFPALDALSTSARVGTGIDELKTRLVSLLSGRTGPAELPGVVPNLRQKQLLQKALRASTLTLEALEADRSPELVAVDLQEAVNCLGEVIGVKTSGDLLEKIFDQFCIGK